LTSLVASARVFGGEGVRVVPGKRLESGALERFERIESIRGLPTFGLAERGLGGLDGEFPGTVEDLHLGPRTRSPSMTTFFSPMSE